MQPRPMPKINLSRQHNLPADVIKQRLDALGTKMQERFQAKTSWEGDKTLNVKGTGVTGKLVIGENRGYQPLGSLSQRSGTRPI